MATLSTPAGETTDPLVYAAGPRDAADVSPVGIRIVALGGGTGLPVVLRGLKGALFGAGEASADACGGNVLTAIVTAADDGGSSGRLRDAYRLVPPGDIRNCLLALSEGDATLSAIFDFRFAGDAERGIGGHSLGNLILAALSHLERDFLLGVERATRMLSARGRVLPATLDDVRLVAEFTDESRVEGESRIAAAGRIIRRVALHPADARAVPEARRAIAAADLVVLGPGSLYTSVIPVLLVPELAAAVAATPARVLLVANLMSEPGETDGYDAADLVRAITRHAPGVAIDDVLLNTAPLPETWCSDPAARPIRSDPDALRGLGCRPVERDLLGTDPLIRHDATKLARAIVELALEGASR